MIRAGRAFVALSAVTSALAGTACGHGSAGTGDAPASKLDTPAPSLPPADHLGPNELIEGTDRVFGITLPRGLVIEERYPDTVNAGGTMTVHALVLYFRARLQGGSLRESERVATFEHVTTPDLPPYTDLSIHLSATLNETRAQLVTTPHPPAPALPDVSARWKQVGLTPDGKILDPTHLD